MPVKLPLFILLCMLLHVVSVKGQDVTFSSNSFVNNEYTNATATSLWYPHKDECKATREGRKALIGGGIELVVGTGLIVLAGSLSSGNSGPNNNAGLLPLLLGGLCFFGGSVCILGGSAAYIGGKIHDKRNRRYSLIGSKNQVGIAYNFGR